jgi:hypothetical protein
MRTIDARLLVTRFVARPALGCGGRKPPNAVGLDLCLGVRLRWAEISSVKRGVKSGFPVLLIVPTAPEAVVGQVRPWLRSEARSHLARYGTPIVVSGQSMDHSVDDILSAIHQHHPASRS